MFNLSREKELKKKKKKLEDATELDDQLIPFLHLPSKLSSCDLKERKRKKGKSRNPNHLLRRRSKKYVTEKLMEVFFITYFRQNKQNKNRHCFVSLRTI